ncbi:isopenicillin-N N-acyltransferase-like protein [Tamaricihabitans halophyticus]|uniref:Isopenicillin-N N-acyltransferase-like protein n=1 Tax=Tamaricihabitans halophyticus TaxID=1262583 RepID=A0A4R2QKH9_9PSEU|nr:C45 family peptidase [Tamaricihabitans halophyticus]TCP49942.1 isopenicillin-N N-acyltransferase-like protein [Tamaricihabitans halophyticus]
MNPAIPRYVSTETDPAARGSALGATYHAEIAATYATYTGLFGAHGLHPDQLRDYGLAALGEIRAWAPELATEIAGIAEGSGLPEWQLGVLNARTEILAAATVNGAGECSASVVLPSDGAAPRTMQTWDWHDTHRDVMLAWQLEPTPGHRVATFTEYGLLGKIGVNSAGLGLHFNVLRHHSDSARIGVPVHMVARRILDQASTVAEAARIARSARLSASSVLTVVTRTEARCLELCPAGVGEVLPEDGFLLHTNHFLAPELADGERTLETLSSTFEREAWLRSRAAAALSSEDRTDRAHAFRAHRADGAPVCAHPDPALPAHERWETLATISLDVLARRMYVHRGGPCTVDAESWLCCATEEEMPI